MYHTICPMCSGHADVADYCYPVQCPHCSLFYFPIPCAYCNALLFLPNSDGSCWQCKRQNPGIMSVSTSSGFLGGLFGPKCPHCRHKDKVFYLPERYVGSKADFITDWYEGGLYPRHLNVYSTRYFCSRCGNSWDAKRVESHIKYG